MDEENRTTRLSAWPALGISSLFRSAQNGGDAGAQRTTEAQGRRTPHRPPGVPEDLSAGSRLGARLPAAAGEEHPTGRREAGKRQSRRLAGHLCLALSEQV